jgi:hypothetical protein
VMVHILNRHDLPIGHRHRLFGIKGSDNYHIDRILGFWVLNHTPRGVPSYSNPAATKALKTARPSFVACRRRVWPAQIASSLPSQLLRHFREPDLLLARTLSDAFLTATPPPYCGGIQEGLRQ